MQATRITTWRIVYWSGLALLVASLCLWAVVAIGLSTLGARTHSAASVVGGTAVLTALPILLGGLMVRAGRRRKSAIASVVTRTARFVVLTPLRLTRLLWLAACNIARWVRGGGPATAVAASVDAGRRMGKGIVASPATAREAARLLRDALRAAREERRHDRAVQLEEALRARVERASSVSDPPHLDLLLPTARMSITARWLVSSRRPAPHPSTTAFILRGRWDARLLVAIPLLVFVFTAVTATLLWTTGDGERGAIVLAVALVSGWGAWGFAWQEIAEVRFEAGYIRFIAPLREVLVLPGEVLEICRKGADDSEGDNRHLSVITTVDALRLPHAAPIEDLEAALHAWNPTARLTGRW